MEQTEMMNELKVIVFRLKDEEYGVEVGQVKSIERLEHITRVPNTPPFVKGVINLRGVVTPIIDLRRRFDFETTDFTDSTRIIVVHVQDKEVGLIVDAANDVIDIPADQIEPPPKVVGGRCIPERGRKTGKKIIDFVNLDKVLNENEIKELDEIES